MKFQKFSLGKVKQLYGTPKFDLPPSWRPDFTVENVQKDLEGIGDVLAQKFYAFLLENIKTNHYNFKLLPETERKKGSWVGSVPWIDSRTLISALMVDGTTVGFQKGKYPGSSLDYDQLAQILEYGMKERGVPPRDVFRQSFRDFKPIAEEYIRQFDLKPL